MVQISVNDVSVPSVVIAFEQAMRSTNLPYCVDGNSCKNSFDFHLFLCRFQITISS